MIINPKINNKLQHRNLALLACIGTLASITPEVSSASSVFNLSNLTVNPIILAGDPGGSPTDSPSNRIDPNVPTSSFAGVGGVSISTESGNYMCSGTAISSNHVISAAHCFDPDKDGIDDSTDVNFILNNDGSSTQTISASRVDFHPDFTGFNNPSLSDDIAIITLSSSLDSSIPTYNLSSTPLESGDIVTLVGYGRSGDGVDGFSTNATFDTKRTGQNQIDVLFADDEGSSAREVFLYDFDGPTGNGITGGPTLGNDIESTVGGGDSGGPAFVFESGEFVLAGINTFNGTYSGQPEAPLFGSVGGGTVLAPYLIWIQAIMGASPASIAIKTPSMSWLILCAMLILKRYKDRMS